MTRCDQWLLLEQVLLCHCSQKTGGAFSSSMQLLTSLQPLYSWQKCLVNLVNSKEITVQKICLHKSGNTALKKYHVKQLFLKNLLFYLCTCNELQSSEVQVYNKTSLCTISILYSTNFSTFFFSLECVHTGKTTKQSKCDAIRLSQDLWSKRFPNFKLAAFFQCPTMFW